MADVIRDKHSVSHHSLSLLGVLVSLGIVYGDIGTSPLYVMKAIIGASSHLDEEYIIGAVSCIIWTLTLQTTIKYVCIALRADNRGEGGILALYALVRKRGKPWLYLIAALGAGTLVADGVITPAITVLSAVEGLKVYEPDTPILPIAITILAVLFFVQQFGTKAIGRLFGPIMFLWFTMLGVAGILHVGSHLSILRAFNPYYGISLLATHPEWFLVLGAVFLCTTGAEALYSDLGHCGKGNIRVSWAFVKSMLILNYLGQGAWIINHPQAIHPDTNPFYAIIPPGWLPFAIALATLAAIVASQALISGSFTIFSEAMNLKFWPRQKIKYPTDVKGQLYIPFVNGGLFLLCIVVILLFGSSGNMEAAYGLSITVTMLMTTVLLGVFMQQHRWNKALIGIAMITYIGIESVFLVANLAKFMHGGWVTMLLAGSIFAVMYIWYNAHRIRSVFVLKRDIRDYFSVIADIKADETIRKFATNVVYLSKLPGKYEVEQKVLYSIINKRPMRADHYILLHVDYQDQPSTLEYDFHELLEGTIYKINLRLGFRVQPLVNVYLRQVIEDQVAQGRFSIRSGFPSLRKHHITGNFIFLLIHRIYTNTNMLSAHQKFVMSAYHQLSRMKQNIRDAMGLDTSNVLCENVPMSLKMRKVERIQAAENTEEDT